MPRQAHVVADHLQIAGQPDLPQRQPHLQRPEAARVLRTVVEVVRRPRDRSGSSSDGRRTRAADRRAAAPARSRLRAARRATCADRRPPNRRRAIARRLVGRSGHPRGERAVRAIDVKPDVMAPADGGDLRQRIDGARADRCRPCRRRGTAASPLVPVGDDLPFERGDIHPLLVVGRESSESRRCPGRTGRRPSGSTCAFRSTRRRAAALGIDRRPVVRTSASPWRRAPRGSRRSSPCCRRSPAARRRRSETRSAPQSSGSVCASISVAIGDSRHAPTFWLTADGQQIAERADRRRARRDVAEEARMAVEQRVLEEQLRGFVEQRAARRCRPPAVRGPRSARGGRRPATRRASPGRPAAAPASRRSGPRGRWPAARNVGGAHVERSRAASERFDVLRRHHRSPSNRSDSRARPPFTRLNAR